MVEVARRPMYTGQILILPLNQGFQKVLNPYRSTSLREKTLENVVAPSLYSRNKTLKVNNVLKNLPYTKCALSEISYLLIRFEKSINI